MSGFRRLSWSGEAPYHSDILKGIQVLASRIEYRESIVNPLDLAPDRVRRGLGIPGLG